VLAEKCRGPYAQRLEGTEYVRVLPPMRLETWMSKIYGDKLVDAKSIVTTLLALRRLDSRLREHALNALNSV
jgi:hypothetical protein